jgi:cytochrome P450
MPAALAEIRPLIEAEAVALVEQLVARRSFDAAVDLAHHLPLTIVAKLVGLPEEGRQNMLRWSAATFDALGGANERCEAARPLTMEMRSYVQRHAGPTQVRPGSWAARLYQQGEAGVVAKELCPVLMRDYLGPSLDTTILATGSTIALFARHPDQWDVLRANPALIPAAINEVLRLESPVRGFTRVLTAAHEVDGTALPEGARVVLLFASANRDERKWPEPERFDIRRTLTGSLGFGAGIHMCAGQHLARMEIAALLSALIPRVARFEAKTAVPFRNNTLRGLQRLDVVVHPV